MKFTEASAKNVAHLSNNRLFKVVVPWQSRAISVVAEFHVEHMVCELQGRCRPNHKSHNKHNPYTTVYHVNIIWFTHWVAKLKFN